MSPRATPDRGNSSRRSTADKKVVVSPHITVLGVSSQATAQLSASRGRSGPILLKDVFPNQHQHRGRQLIRRNSTSDIDKAQRAYEMNRKGRRESSPGERQMVSPAKQEAPKRTLSNTDQPRPILRRSSSVEAPRSRSVGKQVHPLRRLARQMSQQVLTTQERSRQEKKLCEIALRQMQRQQQKALQKVADRVRDNDEMSSRRSNELPFPKSLDDLFSHQIDDPMYDSAVEDDDESFLSVFQWSVTERQEEKQEKTNTKREHSPSPTSTVTEMTLKKREKAFGQGYNRSSTRSLPVMQQEVPEINRSSTFDKYERAKSSRNVRTSEDKHRRSKKSSKDSEKKSKKKKKSSSSKDSGRRRHNSNSSDELRISGSDNSERRKKKGRSRRRTGSVPAEQSRKSHRRPRRSASIEVRHLKRSASSDGLRTLHQTSSRRENLRRLQSEAQLLYAK